MYNYTDILISKFWPKVEKIEIRTKQTYRSAFGVFTKEQTGHYKPDFAANFPFRCINIDCTSKDFDLFNQVSSAIAQHKEVSSGTLKCEGREAEDHNHSCPCELEYEITIEYQPNANQ